MNTACQSGFMEDYVRFSLEILIRGGGMLSPSVGFPCAFEADLCVFDLLGVQGLTLV